MDHFLVVRGATLKIVEKDQLKIV